MREVERCLEGTLNTTGNDDVAASVKDQIGNGGSVEMVGIEEELEDGSVEMDGMELEDGLAEMVGKELARKTKMRLKKMMERMHTSRMIPMTSPPIHFRQAAAVPAAIVPGYTKVEMHVRPKMTPVGSITRIGQRSSLAFRSSPVPSLAIGVSEPIQPKGHKRERSENSHVANLPWPNMWTFTLALF